MVSLLLLGPRRVLRLDTLGEFSYVLPKMRRGLRLLSALIVVGFAATSSAVHEPDHRYLVIGYVRDGVGSPARQVEVRAIREKTGLEQRARTDRDGFYLLVVHLHTEDLGESLSVSANGTALRITAQFNPLDLTNHRGTRVDFSGSEARERADLFPETLRLYLAQ